MKDIKVIAFDTGGTVLDWHSGLAAAMAEWGAMAVTMNFGPLVLMNSGPPSGVDPLLRAEARSSGSRTSFALSSHHDLTDFRCAVVRRNR